MHRLLLSCRLNPTRLTSLVACLHSWKPRPHERIVRVELERIERGEFVKDSGVLGSILGHEHKRRAVEPDPSSKRWRSAFLNVGAFRRRSIRVQVRKKEFGPDEILHSSISERLSLPAPPAPPQETTIDGVPIEIFAEYVDQRLAEMEDHDDMTSSPSLPSMPEAEADRQPPSPRIEFRTLPFGDGLSEAHRPCGVFRRKVWMSSGRRRKERNRFREAWRREWTHMWSQKCGDHWVPSSIRRFYHHPEILPLPRRAHLYVEDRGDGSRHDPIDTVLQFLKTQWAFRGPAPVTSRRKNTRWPKRRQGMERWSFIQDLSDAIRDGRFRFDWEQQQCTAARFYRWHTKKRPPPPHTPSHGLRLFGQEPPIRKRFRMDIKASTFSLPNEMTRKEGSDTE